MRPFLILIWFLLLALPARSEIVIGIAGPLSGQNAAFGNELRVGVSAAIAAVNAGGGINGETLSLAEVDDGCDARRAVDAAKELIGKDVRLVVGHFCSSASLAAAPTYAQAGVIMITPAASAADLTAKSMWNVFRLTGREDMQAEVAAARIKAEKQDENVLVLTDDLAETSAYVTRFKNALPTAKTVVVKPGALKLPDEPALLTASAVFFAMSVTEAGNTARELRKANPTARFYGPDVLQSEAFQARAVEGAEGTTVTFLNDWLAKADPRRSAPLATTEGATLAAYAAVEVFVAAAKARSVNDSRTMATWISGGNEVSSIVGPLRFNASGDLQSQPYVWYVWQGGNLVPDTSTQ